MGVLFMSLRLMMRLCSSIIRGKMITCPEGRNFIESLPGTARRLPVASQHPLVIGRSSAARVRIFDGVLVVDQEV